MKYFIYCRVSQDREDRQVLSPQSQKKELQDYAKAHNLKVVHTYIEKQTAYKTGRPQFNEMLERIEAGEAQGILVHHLSRIARNTSDGGRVIYMMDEGLIEEIKTKEKTYTNCSDDKFLMQIHFAMNKKSSDDNSSFVKRDILTKLENKEYPGKAPIGYLNISKDGVIVGKQFDQRKQAMLNDLGRPLGRIEKDPIIAPLLRQIFDLALTGQYGLNPLRDNAYEIGITSKHNTKLAKNAVKCILLNRFYTGSFDYYDQTWPGTYEPIISKSEFDKIQDLQKNRTRPKHTKRQYVYSMMVRCPECGSLLTGDHQKGSDYLRCAKAKGKDATCSNKTHYRQDEIGRQVVEKLAAIKVPHSIIEWGMAQLEKVYQEESESQLAAQVKLQANLNNLKRQQSNLSAKWLSAENATGDLISDGEYRDIKQGYQEEMDQINEALNNSLGESKNWLNKCEEFFELSRVLVTKYEEASPMKKRELLSAIGSRFILTGNKLTIELNKPYLAVYEAQRKAKSIRTTKKPLDKSLNTHCDQEMVIWQAQ